MPRSFSTGVTVPVAEDRHPSEEWWSQLGATTNAAILDAKGSLSEAVKRDFVPRTEAEQYGIPGPPTDISIGTVTSDGMPAASITGDAPSQTLHLTLPYGPRGPEGPGGAFQLKETSDPGLFEVSDVPNAVIDASVQAAINRILVNVPPRYITSALPGVTSGALTVSRFGPLVLLKWDDVVVTPTPQAPYTTITGVVPMGFRPASRYSYFTTPARPTNTSTGTARVDMYGNVTIYNHAASDTIRGTWIWRTIDAPPTA